MVFLIYLLVACWGCTMVKEGLERRRLSRDDSYSVDFYDREDKYFREFPYRVQVFIRPSFINLSFLIFPLSIVLCGITYWDYCTVYASLFSLIVSLLTVSFLIELVASFPNVSVYISLFFVLKLKVCAMRSKYV